MRRWLPAGKRYLVFLTAAGLCGCSPLSVLSAVSPSSHYERTADLAYGDGERDKLDIYQPEGVVANAPLVVYFYGGGWSDGSKEEFEFVASSLTKAGLVVAIPDYRLFPDVVFPAFVEDGARATAWAIENAERFGADRGKVFLMGHSAGAQIAALLALDESYLAPHGIETQNLTGLIGLSGPYDFLPVEEGYLLDLFPEETRAQSQAINYVTERSPPTLLVHGGDDDIVYSGNSERLAARMQEFSVPVTLQYYESIGHARVVLGLSPPLKFLAGTLDVCVAFIQQRLKEDP